MTSEYGYKLNPHRKLRKQKGIKGMRRTLFNTHVPSTIDQGGILAVRFPDLGPNDVIVPGTSKLSFKIQLNSDDDANRTIVNNLGRAIVSKLEVKLRGRSIFILDSSDVFLCYQDLWKTTNERSNAVYQGIQSEALRKIRINAGDKGTAAKDVAIGTMYDNLFCIPLDFEILESHMPFFQSELKDRLSYELTFNNYGSVIVSSDTNASYTITDIHLEFEVLTSPELATNLKRKYEGKHTVLYDRVIRHSKLTLNKSDTIWNIALAPQAKSMKAILILFVDPADGGTAYSRDTEKFYNPKIANVMITLDGNPNQLFASGMRPHQQFSEIKKIFADGKHRTNTHVAKELELADIELEDYATTKYALCLDMRTTDDDSLHGSGRKIEGASQSIQIQIEKKAETAGNLDAYVYYIHDAQLNFERSRLVNTIY